MIPDFADYFCLKPSRDSFTVDPARDDLYLFGPPEWAAQIEYSFRRSLLLNKPLRILWWGDYGIGKTHRINHAIRYIRDAGIPFYPVRVDCSDITDKSGFERLHFPMVNNLGAEGMHAVVEGFYLKFRQKQTSINDWSDLVHSGDVIGAIKNFGSENPDNWRAAWRWLTGVKLDAKDELKLAGVTKRQMDSSVEYAEVLRALSLIIESETNKRLVYFIDQVERLSKITNANAQSTWVETIRAILDMSQIGVVLAIGASRLDQLPAVVLASEVASRFGKEAYEKFKLSAYNQQETALFLEQLFAEWIDPAKRDALAAQQGWSMPAYDPRLYPFDAKGFDMFCRNITHDPRDAKPRAFLEKLDNVAAEACLKQVRLIDQTLLRGMGYSD